MARQTADDFDPEVLRLFDQYVHGAIDRRGFLERAARYAAGATGAVALLAALSPKFAEAQQVKPDDRRIGAERREFDSPQGYGKASGYLVRPAEAAGQLPLVLVAHENRGLNPHIEDVARRFALAGYIAFAPDALFPIGGYPGDEDAARAKFATLDQAKVREDFRAAAKLLQGLHGGTGKVGAIGFCWGGGMVNWLAVHDAGIAAAVPFYGVAPPLDDVDLANVKAELLLVFAANDERVNATWPAYEAALKAAHVKYEAVTYPGTQHGFHNDTTPRYDEQAAHDAWKKSLALFGRVLRA
ncbi:MAG TPA: dienelactone hydrolase family protein [Xanthomonadales bacterium]|nr:dienelactone hydrolase family protein [Xanthomonadales bacterium]